MAALLEGHGRLIRCCLRTLLRGARRIRQSKAPFLFLQERPRKETYSHLWEIQPSSHDAKVLDKLLPPYLRHELSTCELTGQVRLLGVSGVLWGTCIVDRLAINRSIGMDCLS